MWLWSSHAKSPSRSICTRNSFREFCPGGCKQAIVQSCASAASGTSPEQKTSGHSAPVEHHEATHSALFPDGRCRAPSCTAWRYCDRSSRKGAQPMCICIWFPPRPCRVGRGGG